MADSGPNTARPIFDRVATAPHLASQELPSVSWDLRNGPTVYLAYLKGQEDRPTMYRLIEMKHVAGRGMQAKAYEFWAETGDLKSVYRSGFPEAKDDTGKRREILMDMKFQDEVGMSLPTEEEELELDRLLASGLDNWTLRQES